jgi:hypothetical protein
MFEQVIVGLGYWKIVNILMRWGLGWVGLGYVRLGF